MANSLMAPPIRTGLMNNPDGTPLTQANSSDGSGSSSGAPLQTEKSWYYYWRDLGRRLNEGADKLAKLVTYGAHADRGDPANMPNGALYVETDRGVIYANEGGVWQYVAGTMWDTLSPDNRPTDLGAHDAGFDFRTTDQPAREFIWSQTAWVEATPVRYGTHAQRLAVVVAEVIDQLLWVETDRGAIYQLQNGTTWQYLAGTMWGTLSPDQRPTDLGTHDAGFDFRGTDQQREFIWSQTAWVETTSIGGAANLTHPNVVTKVGAVGQIVEGGITDASAGNSGTVQITAPANPDATLVVATGTSKSGIRVGGAEIQSYAVNNSWYAENLYFNGSTWTYRNTGYGVALEMGSGQFRFATAALGTAGAGVAPQIQAVILNNGFFGIGVDPPTFQLQLGTDSAGKPSTSTWSVVSDLRLKQNIEPVKDDSLAILAKLDWIRFEYNGLAGMPPGEKAIGLVAQELQAQLPEAVRSTKTKLNKTDAEETGVMAIDYHYIIVHSARAIQQLNAELQSLKALIVKP